MPGVRTFSRSVRGVALASIVIAVVLFATVSALANHVDPDFEASNPPCPAGTRTLKMEPVADGTLSDGTLTVTVAVNESAQTFDWTSNIGVDAVIAKGGPDGNVYTYNPESTGDTGLHAPDNDGKWYGLSHISFCYDVESPSPSPSVSPSESETPSTSPSPSVSPSESETPSTSPSPSVSPSETETPSSSPSVLPSETETTNPTVSVLPANTTRVLGRKLSRTGMDVIRLALFALALLVLGAFAYVVSTRTARKNR